MGLWTAGPQGACLKAQAHVSCGPPVLETRLRSLETGARIEGCPRPRLGKIPHELRRALHMSRARVDSTSERQHDLKPNFHKFLVSSPIKFSGKMAFVRPDGPFHPYQLAGSAPRAGAAGTIHTTRLRLRSSRLMHSGIALDHVRARNRRCAGDRVRRDRKRPPATAGSIRCGRCGGTVHRSWPYGRPGADRRGR